MLSPSKGAIGIYIGFRHAGFGVQENEVGNPKLKSSARRRGSLGVFWPVHDGL